MNVESLRAHLSRLQLPPGTHPGDEHSLMAFHVPQNGWYGVAAYFLPHTAAFAMNAECLWERWNKDPDELLSMAGEYVAALWKGLSMKEAA